MAVTKRTRFEVLKRDNFTCRYCRSAEGEMTVDHVTQVALGGGDGPDNLVACCKDCNAGKSSTAPDASAVEDVKNSDARWAEAMKRAAEIKSSERDLWDAYHSRFLHVWDRYLPSNYEGTIHAFYKAGLPIDELVDAAYYADTNKGVDNRWRYLCGIAWRKVRDIQEIAKSLLEAEVESGSDA